MIPRFTFGAAYVPSLQEAVRAIQDADTSLLGHPRSGSAMASHRASLLALCRFLKPLKVL